MKKIIVFLALVSLVACTPMSRDSQEAAYLSPASQGSSSDTGNGVVNYIWEEPMVDTVDVPPGLDPEGTYYRPGHEEVVEVRQGRWQHYK